MKKFKKLASLLLAAMMVLAMAIPAMATSASGSYSITINDANDGHMYEAYQIFDGTLSEGTLSNIEWGAGISNKSELLLALKGDTSYGSLFTDAKNAEDVALVLSKEAKEAGGVANVIDSELMKWFASMVSQYLDTSAAKVSGTYESDSYKISELDAGYYLVQDKNPVTGEDAATRFILQVVGNATATPKASAPSVEKKVYEADYLNNAEGTNHYGEHYNDVADYNMGDTVSFRLYGTLPDTYADYTTYHYSFIDTLCKGLTYNEGSLSVKVQHADGNFEETAIDARNYVLDTKTDPESGETTLTVTFTDLKTAVPDLTISDRIVVEYTATLNQNAEVGLNGNENKVKLEFSNNPNVNHGGEQGTTPEQKVVVFTYELDTTKEDENHTGLQNAEFVLYREVDGKKQYAVIDNGEVLGWTEKAPTIHAVDNTVDYPNLEPDFSAGTIKLVSDEKGLFKVAGLEDGTYYLLETKAPDGYNKLRDAVELKIVATTENNQNWTGTAENALKKLEITVGTLTKQGNTSSGIVDTEVINKSGATLPSTGGIGTTIFYVLGSILVLGAVIVLVTKKRMSVEK